MVGKKLKQVLFGIAIGSPLLIAACRSDAVLFPSFSKGPAKNDSVGVSVAGMTTGIAVTAANLNKCVERIPIRGSNNRAIGAQVKPAIDVEPTHQKRSEDLTLVSLVSFATSYPRKATRQIDCVFEGADEEVIPFLKKEFGTGSSAKTQSDPIENADIITVGGSSCAWFESQNKFYCWGGGGGGGGETECTQTLQLRASGIRTGDVLLPSSLSSMIDVGFYVCETDASSCGRTPLPTLRGARGVTVCRLVRRLGRATSGKSRDSNALAPLCMELISTAISISQIKAESTTGNSRQIHSRARSRNQMGSTGLARA